MLERNIAKLLAVVFTGRWNYSYFKQFFSVFHNFSLINTLFKQHYSYSECGGTFFFKKFKIESLRVDRGPLIHQTTITSKTGLCLSLLSL